MSANYSKSDGFLFSVHDISQESEAAIAASFDTGVSMDIADIERESTNIKFSRRVCIIRSLAFPLELPLTLLLLSSSSAKDLIYCQKIYWAFIFKRISYTEFKKRLAIYA